MTARSLIIALALWTFSTGVSVAATLQQEVSQQEVSQQITPSVEGASLSSDDLEGAQGVRTSRAGDTGIALADALKAALQKSPDVALAGEIKSMERASLRAASSAFEPHLYGSIGSGQSATPLSSLQRPSPDVRTSSQSYQQYEFGVHRRFRSGIEVTPTIQMTRTVAGEVAVLNETSAGLSLLYPVVGGRTRSTDRAAEDAAAQRVVAADMDEVQAKQSAMTGAALAYWDYVGAALVLETLTEAEDQAIRLLVETEILVAADERPAADLITVQADLARRRAVRLQAKQSAFEAQQALALAMGDANANDMGLPSDELPVVRALPHLDEKALVAVALERRTDLHAADRRYRAAVRMLTARRADHRPALDLVVDAAYSALSEGSAESYQYLPLGIGATRGNRVGVSLQINRLGSGAARAASRRAAAERDRLRILHDDAARRIRAEVAFAIASLRSSAAEVSQTRAAVALYEEAVENERRRLRLSMGTLFDVQMMEERLINARVEAVRSEVRYAQALGQLRAATGTLLAEDPVGTAARLHALPNTQ